MGFFCGLNSAKTPLGPASPQTGALSQAAVPRSKPLVHWPCVPFDWLAVLLWEATGSPLNKCGNFGHSSCSLPCTSAVLPALPGSQGLCLMTDTSLLHTHAASSLAGTVQLEQQQILLQAAARHVAPLLHCPARNPSSLAILLCCLQTETMVC